MIARVWTFIVDLRGKTISLFVINKDKKIKELTEQISVLEETIRKYFQNLNESISADLSTTKKQLQLHEEEKRGIQLKIE